MIIRHMYATYESRRHAIESGGHNMRDMRNRSVIPKGHNIIVIGTSAGGLEALDSLVSQLPSDLPSTVFVV